MAVLKNITSEYKHLVLNLRDFENQEGDNATGAKVELKVNDTRIQPMNYDTDVVTLDKDCGRELLAVYDLSKFVDGEMDTIEINEVSNYSHHCVITKATMGNMTAFLNQTTLNNYWGKNYTTNWGGEMGHADGMDDIADIASDPYWIETGSVEGINEGLKLQKEATISRVMTISNTNSLMTLAVRNFGGADEDYAGGVSVNGTFLKAVGDDKTYFTKKTSATYFEGASDGGEVATMKTYDLSAYIGRKVFITIANLKCYAMGGNEDLVIGSVSFTEPREVKSTTHTTFDASEAKNFYPDLPFTVAGPFTIYNEGVSFRTNDFAGGIAQRFDLSDVEIGKNFYVKTYWRTLQESETSASFQKIVNGKLVGTVDATLKDSGSDLVCVDFDLTNYAGDIVDVALHIKSRNYRVVLTQLEYYTEGEAATPDMSFTASSKAGDNLTLTNGTFGVISNSTSRGYSDVNGATFANDDGTNVKLLSRNLSFNKENLAIVINAASPSFFENNGTIKVYLGDELMGEKNFAANVFSTQNYLFKANNVSTNEGSLRIVMEGNQEIYLNSINIYGTFTTKTDAIQDLVDQLTQLDTCTEYSQAPALRSKYEALSEDEKVLFARENIVDQDENEADVTISAMSKLEYMEYLNQKATGSTGANNNTMISLGKSGNIYFIAIVSALGLVSILGYYFLNKKRKLN